MRYQFATIATLLWLLLVGAAFAADPPPPPPLTVAGLTSLLGKPLPNRFNKYTDLNAEDHYARGIDVRVGEEALRLGTAPRGITLQLFVRDGKVGAVKVVQQSMDRKGDAGMLYEMLVEELRDKVGATQRRGYRLDGRAVGLRRRAATGQRGRRWRPELLLP
jgi:hypothetical protein